MVGPGHAGVVEKGGGVGLTRVGEDEIFCGGIEVGRSWVEESAGVGDRGRGRADGGKGEYTGC